MNHGARFDWIGCLVHFLCGAILGAGIGFGIWAKSPHSGSVSNTTGLIYVGGAALVCGVISGFFGDRFWRNAGDWFRWP